MRFFHKPSERHAHLAWLIVAAFVALFVTRTGLFIITLGVFFVLWLVGFGVLVHIYHHD